MERLYVITVFAALREPFINQVMCDRLDDGTIRLPPDARRDPGGDHRPPRQEQDGNILYRGRAIGTLDTWIQTKGSCEYWTRRVDKAAEALEYALNPESVIHRINILPTPERLAS